MKVVINKCFGGFGLSAQATKELAKLNGKECYFFTGGLGEPYEEITLEEANTGVFWVAFSVKDPNTYIKTGEEEKENVRYMEMSLNDWGLERSDPKLIQVVEKLGSKQASAGHAELTIVEIPDGIQWHVEEYDGNEHIAEDHRTWG